MEVSFFSSTNDKGISNYSRRLLDAIDKVKYKDIKIKFVGLDDISLIHFNVKKYINALKVYKRLGREMNQADIAHIQYESSLFCLWTNPLEFMYPRFRRQIKIPTVITIHELEERKRSKTFIKNFIKSIYYVILKRYLVYVNVVIFNECQSIIVHTYKSKEILTGRGVNPQKIHVIPHAIDAVEKSTFTTEEDKMKFGAAGKFVLTTFGFISERKGQDRVIDILDRLPENVVYIIAGKVNKEERIFMDYYDALQEKIKAKNLTERVIFTGFVKDEDIKYIMNATDIIVSPSRDITASGSISDAIGYNKAIIASDLDFVKEINTSIECIKTFDRNSSDDFLSCLTNMIEDENARIKYANNTKQYAKDFNFESAALKTIDIYKNLYMLKF